MANQIITEGAILELCIDNQYYVYAQILGKAGYAFFDFASNKRMQEFKILQTREVLFILSVYNDVVTRGKWRKVGKLPIREDLQTQPLQYIQDIHYPDRFELYDPNTGEITKATREQCEGLECAAVWEASHVEDRIRDHYLGVPNIWVEQLAIK